MNVAGTERTRLFVEGVGTAITAEVTRRERDGLVVAQALPFLRLDTPVVAGDGRRARIARVTIAMDDDVPRLLLELADEPLEAPVIADEPMPPAFTPGVSLRRARTDSTVPYDFHPRARATRTVAVSEPPPPPVRAEPTVAARVDAPSASPPRAEPWWSRLARRLSALIGHWTRRAVPALPRG